jgi:hypothetical protein
MRNNVSTCLLILSLPLIGAELIPLNLICDIFDSFPKFLHAFNSWFQQYLDLNLIHNYFLESKCEVLLSNFALRMDCTMCLFCR